ncbi:MAG TPA: phage holin family protein [Solirubrobacterales bacterium]|nr:phage holin family protein [Solirubrobacterales bacterium]
MERGASTQQTPPQTGERNDERSVKELIEGLSEQTQALARKEVELAKAEVTEKGKRLGMGAGAFGAAGIIGLFAVGALTAALVLLLATAMETWVAALIVAAVYAAIAGIAALVGRGQVQRGTPPVPEMAIDSTKEDVETVKRSAREGHA